jgi:hypothetical protein
MAAVVVLILVAFVLALTWSSDNPDAAVPGVSRDGYPRVGITTDQTPFEGDRTTPPSCRSASDGSIVARPFVTENPPRTQQPPDPYAPPSPEVPWSERQDCPSV